MNTLIIGGSGGLSGELARQLTRCGGVWTLTRGQRPVPDGVHALTADRHDTQAFTSALLNESMHWDAVFDCICMNEDDALLDEELLPQVTSRLIVVSTDSVYSPYHKRVPQNEEGIFIEEEGPAETIGYGANKRRMEKVFLERMGRSALNVTLFRPGHIYGPGFKLGCFPEESRRDDLEERIRAGEPMKLVGAGEYLIQPIFVSDLARVMIDSVYNVKTYNEVFCIGGPERIPNRRYYEILGRLMGTGVKVEPVPGEGYLEAHPEYSGHLCDRSYDLSKLASTGIVLPQTTLEQGLPVKKNTER